MIIVSTHYNRPKCTQQCINHLENCIGIENCTVLFFVEPCMTEIVDILSKSNLNKKITINSKLLGLWENKKQAVKKGFDNDDFVIVVEDDVLLSKDALVYFEWAEERFKNDKTIKSVTAYNNDDHILEPYMVSKRNWYNSTAWATWLDRYELLNDWTGEDKDFMKQLFDDVSYEVFPRLSRAQNIGHVNGEKSIAKDVLDVTGIDITYATIGLSKNSTKGNVSFVANKENYLNKIKNESEKSDEPILKDQINKCSMFETFDEQLIVNENGDEFIKLNNFMYKSRDNVLYKQKYYLERWANNIMYEKGDFYFE